MNPKLRKELWRRFKEVRCEWLFNEFIYHLEGRLIHIRHPQGEAFLQPTVRWNLEFIKQCYK